MYLCVFKKALKIPPAARLKVLKKMHQVQVLYNTRIRILYVPVGSICPYLKQSEFSPYLKHFACGPF